MREFRMVKSNCNNCNAATLTHSSVYKNTAICNLDFTIIHIIKNYMYLMHFLTKIFCHL